MAQATNRSQRQAVVYVSYDGMLEPLGRSQVLGYLRHLAQRYDVTLISFEKSEDGWDPLRVELEAARISWIPLTYHSAPPVLSTAWDVARGRRALRVALKERPDALVHVRSYVPALIAQAAPTAPLLFDIRGFWADERVEGGIWPPGGLLYRLAKRCERRFFARADAVVTLTEASLPQVRRWLAGREVPVEVIPTCVDPTPYARSVPAHDGPRLIWSGSLGTWYRFDLAVSLADALGLPMTVLTRQREEARVALGSHTAEIRTVAPGGMAGELHAGDIGLALVVSSFSKQASAPTRIGEYLAAGMPIAVTPGVGDLELLAERDGVGVVIRDEAPAALRRAGAELLALAHDPEVQERCRRVARERFDVEAGSRAYATLYERLLDARPAGGH
jgi:glycosyltransferase involved in cell wall biosynthesis